MEQNVVKYVSSLLCISEPTWHGLMEQVPDFKIA